MSASALAAAPGATTSPATNVTANAATLNGTVFPAQESTTYHFEYGRTTAYGTSTPDRGPLNGNAGKSVSADITGLAPSTVYHFRVVATNASGTTQGADATFTTPAAGPAGPAVTIKAIPGTVTFGKTTTLSGVVTGKGSSGAITTLQSTPFNFTTPFKSIATGRTDAAGNYSFPNQHPGINTRYRVTAKTSPPATSRYVTVHVRPAITLRVNDRTPARGQRVRFSGNVTPERNGLVVKIQRHTSRGWRTVSTPTLRAATPGTGGVPRSRYSRRIKIRRSGTYRTVLSKSPGFSGNHTRKHRLRVH